MSFLKRKEKQASDELEKVIAELNLSTETNTELQRQIEDLKTQVEQAATYKSEFERVSQELKEKEGRISELEALVETQEEHCETVDEQVANKVEENLSNLGVEAVETSEDDEVTPEPSITDKFSSMNADERLKFYRENRSELLKFLGSGQ